MAYSTAVVRPERAGGGALMTHVRASCTCGWVGVLHPTRTVEGHALAQRDADEHANRHAVEAALTVAEETIARTLAVPVTLVEPTCGHTNGNGPEFPGDTVCVLPAGHAGGCDDDPSDGLCNIETSDGNRDDPTYWYCGHPAGHGGDCGAWRA